MATNELTILRHNRHCLQFHSIAHNYWLTENNQGKYMKINILYRFNLYPHLVVDDNRNIWELPHCYNKRTKPLRKLTYYKERDSYRYNNGYLKRSRLAKLMYESKEIYGKDENICPF